MILSQINNNRPFQILTAITLIAVIVPNLIQDGMFMDGMIYSTVAKNLANGEGSIWDLHLSISLMNHYRDQPPLTIWITALFFKILGNSLYTERIYSFICVIMLAILIRVIWRNIYYDNPKRKLWWLPVLLFVITPIAFWCYQNNMEENTMVIFSLAAFNQFLLVVIYKNKAFLNCFIAGIFLMLAAMCKGIQGIFPLITPFAFWVLFPILNFKRAMLYLLFALSAIVLIGIGLYLYPPANDYLYGYYLARIHPTFNDESTFTTNNRFFLLYRIMCELLVPLGLMTLVHFIQKNRIAIDKTSTSDNKRFAFIAFIIGLAGVLPLMVTLEQRSFYLLTPLPFFIIGISILFSNRVLLLAQKLNGKVLMIVNYILLVIVLFFSGSKVGQIRKHKEMLTDIYNVGRVVPPNFKIQVSQMEYSNWSLYLYFKRYLNIDIDFSPAPYFLKSKGDYKTSIQGYELVHTLPLNGFDLYRKY